MFYDSLEGITVKFLHKNFVLLLFTAMVMSGVPAVLTSLFEPPRGKTNNVVSKQVHHKPDCTSTEDD